MVEGYRSAKAMSRLRDPSISHVDEEWMQITCGRFMGPGFEHYEPSAMIEWPHLPGASTNQREEFAAQERVAS